MSKYKYIIVALISIVMLTAIKNLLYSFVAAGVLFFGLFVYLNPVKVIDIQKEFYKLINWNIEPISMDKEIRNTKLMGMILIVFVIATCFYIWID